MPHVRLLRSWHGDSCDDCGQGIEPEQPRIEFGDMVNCLGCAKELARAINRCLREDKDE